MAGAVLLGVAAVGPIQAEEGRSSRVDPVVTRPAGDANKSRFEYVPEAQPSARYNPPGSHEDIFDNEVEMLRTRVRELEVENDTLRTDIKVLQGRIVAAKKER